MRLAILRWAGAGLVSLAVGGAAHASTVVISNTGPLSFNSATVTTTTTINRTNLNFVTVSNTNNQTATSGNANSFLNTFGGSAWTGAASNWNSGSTWVSVSN